MSKLKNVCMLSPPRFDVPLYSAKRAELVEGLKKAKKEQILQMMSNAGVEDTSAVKVPQRWDLFKDGKLINEWLAIFDHRFLFAGAKVEYQKAGVIATNFTYLCKVLSPCRWPRYIQFALSHNSFV